MKDLNLTICCNTRNVTCERGFLGINGENLQGRIVINFKNEATFMDGKAFLEIEQCGEKFFVEMEKDAENFTYFLPIKSSLLKYACKMKCQVVIRQESEAIFKSELFYLHCSEAINAIEAIPEQYPLWFDEINAKIASFEEGAGNTQIIDEMNARLAQVEQEFGDNLDELNTKIETKASKEYVDAAIRAAIYEAWQGEY